MKGLLQIGDADEKYEGTPVYWSLWCQNMKDLINIFEPPRPKYEGLPIDLSVRDQNMKGILYI